jgi:O-antigen/teichoic acid export membrane protein
MARKEQVQLRVLMIGHGAVFQLVNAFSTAIVAFLVIKTNHTLLWGKFAGVWLLITWFTLLFNFGSKDFLLKKFSNSNNNKIDQLHQLLQIRLPILILCCIISFFIIPLEQAILLVCILCMIFIVNSFQPLLIFEQKFRFLMFTEMLAITIQLAFLLMIGNDLNLPYLLSSFLIYNVLKVIAFYYGSKNSFSFSKLDFDFALFKSLWPFFLLTLGGMLVNKSDFMMVTTLLEDENKAFYQIISTFSTMGIIAANAILQPFIKQIYRVNWEVFNQIARKYFVAGILLSLIYTVSVYFGISLFFNFQLSLFSIILLYAIELAFFAINPLVFYLFREEKQKHFVVIVLTSGLISLLTAWLLVPVYGMEGALWSNLIGNLCMWLLLWSLKHKLDTKLGILKSNKIVV